jgi:hypothetical protein
LGKAVVWNKDGHPRMCTRDTRSPMLANHGQGCHLHCGGYGRREAGTSGSLRDRCGGGASPSMAVTVRTPCAYRAVMIACAVWEPSNALVLPIPIT